MYRLFHQFAHQYDLHTPPDHYQHDHAFVIAEALRVAPENCRLLDVGCGTGAFLAKAIAAGIDAHGVDASEEMIDVARQRVGSKRVRVERMQAIEDTNAYDVVCSLSWTIHYCETAAELDELVRRCNNALRSNGLLIFQVANDSQMTGAVSIDREPGHSGQPDDTLLIHRFRPICDAERRVMAEYVYVSQTRHELLFEQHDLRFAAPAMICNALTRSGVRDVNLVNPTSLSPFVLGRRAQGRLSR